MACKPVQHLADNGVRALPREYVQPRNVFSDNARDNRSQVPVLDLSKLRSSSKSTRREALRAMEEACSEWGAFQLINHGIPTKVLQGMKQAAQHFYKVPVEDKMKYFVTVFDGRPMRYSTSFNASKDTVLEWKDVLRIPAERPANDKSAWPSEEHLPSDPVNKYSKQMNEMVSALLEAMSESLGLPTSYINNALASRERILAMNFYPPCPNPEKAIGLGAHSDSTAVTVLVDNEVDGLQFFHDNKWITANLLPNALLINLGDQMQILSNGKYHSVEHRAIVNKDKLRISVATLFGPAKSSSIQPAPQLVDEAHPALYRPVVFQDYLIKYISEGLNTREALRQVETSAGRSRSRDCTSRSR